MDKKVKKNHLGRGLEALLSASIPMPAASRTIGQTPHDNQPNDDTPFNPPPDPILKNKPAELSIDKIRPNPYQPRIVWNEQELNDLAQSIKQNGLIQPIVVRPVGGFYEIIAGERRYRAAILAGLTSIPAVVRMATDEEMLELALIENIHRANLNPIERAKAYQTYLQSFSLSQTEAAQKLGEDRSVISNYLRLLDLPQDLQVMLAEEKLSMGHMRAILALPNDELRRKIANRALAGRLSVREVERLVRRALDVQSQTVTEKKQKESYILDLERQLQEILGTKVQIEPKKKGQRGRIIIDYYSLDDFERLTEKMGLKPSEI